MLDELAGVSRIVLQFSEALAFIAKNYFIAQSMCKKPVTCTINFL
jgi:hypothetical protein